MLAIISSDDRVVGLTLSICRIKALESEVDIEATSGRQSSDSSPAGVVCLVDTKRGSDSIRPYREGNWSSSDTTILEAVSSIPSELYSRGNFPGRRLWLAADRICVWSIDSEEAGVGPDATARRYRERGLPLKSSCSIALDSSFSIR